MGSLCSKIAPVILLAAILGVAIVAQSESGRKVSILMINEEGITPTSTKDEQVVGFSNLTVFMEGEERCFINDAGFICASSKGPSAVLYYNCDINRSEKTAAQMRFEFGGKVPKTKFKIWCK